MTKKQTTNHKHKEGFSLIELIVVMTIIALLGSVAAVSFSGSNKKARDSRRMADLEKLRTGLEMARQISGTYPDSLQALVEGTLVDVIPADPKNYSYVFVGDTYVYTMYALMEDLGDTNVSTGTTCVADGTQCNYRVRSP